MSWIVYHNNRCTKSRNALSYLDERGVDYEIVEYLKNPLTKAQLKSLILLLGIKPEELVRKNEVEYKEFLKGKDLNEDDWIEALITYPILIQRPIVVHDNKAVIARPTEIIDSII